MKKKISILFSALKVLLTNGALFRSLMSNWRFFRQARSKNILIVSLTEHLGDIIAAEPISRHLNKKFPGQKIIWIVNKKYIELLENNPVVDTIRTVTCFTEWILLKKLISKNNVYDLHISGKVCEKHGFQLINPNKESITIQNYFAKGNLLYCFSKTAGVAIDPSIAPDIYINAALTEFKGPTVVIHTSTNNPHKNWRTSEWNKLVIDIDEQLKPDKIIEIGFNSYITIEHPKLIRYVSEKKISTIKSLIDNASLFVGVESGFAHMANALDKKSIILIGRLHDFKNYMPYSGKFYKEVSDTIIYSDKPLSETNYEELKPRFIELLKSKK